MNEEQVGQIQKRTIGWKKRICFVLLFLIAAIGGFICWLLPPKEPAYQGKPLSYWLVLCETNHGIWGDSQDSTVIECREAVRHIGTNAVPFLLRILRAKDSAFKIKAMDLMERQNFIHISFPSVERKKGQALMGFYLLGNLASNAVPALVDIYSRPPSGDSKYIAESALQWLYPAPCVAVPYWVPPEQRVSWYLATGVSKLQMSANADAVLAFSDAIKLAPTNAQAYVMRLETKFQLEDIPGTLTDIAKVLELSPTDETAFYYRGMCKFVQKDFKGADADFTTTINLNTNNPAAYNQRGLARGNLRELTGALADFNRAVELASYDASYYRNRAMVTSRQMEYELALEDVSKSIQLSKATPDGVAFALRGRIETALKNYQTALADFDKAIKLNPKDFTVYAFRAMASMYTHDFDKAAADLERTLQGDPNNVGAFLIRGILKAKCGGDDEGALADLKHAVELAPQLPDAYSALGAVQYKTADSVPALANLRQAVKLGNQVNAADIFAYIWIIRTQSGETDGADAELNVYLKSLPETKTNEWVACTARFYTGVLSESDFLDLATTAAKRPSEVKGHVCDSLYFAGMKRKLAGDKPGAAKLFQACLDTKEDLNFSYLNAASELRTLKPK